jgi:hypothetical protein
MTALELTVELKNKVCSIKGDGKSLATITEKYTQLQLASCHLYCPKFRRTFSQVDFEPFALAVDSIIISAWKQQSMKAVHVDETNPDDKSMIESVNHLRPQLENAWDQFWKYSDRERDPRIQAIEEAIRAVTGEFIYLHPSVIGKPGLVSDLMHHRAAAIAARYVSELSGMYNRDTWVEKMLSFSAKEDHVREDLNYLIEDGYSGEIGQSTKSAISLLENWRGLFATGGVAYSELNETLNHLPEGVKQELLCYLSQWHLGRTFSDRLELTTVLNWARHHPSDFNSGIMVRETNNEHRVVTANWPKAFEEVHRQIGRVIESSSASEIRQAMAVVSAYTGLDLNPEKDNDVAIFDNVFDGYKGIVASNIVSFAQDVVNWKMNARRAAIAYNLTAERKIPELGLPKDSAIRFLETSYDVQEAGHLFEVAPFDLGLLYPSQNYYHFVISYNHEHGMVIGDEKNRIIYAAGVDHQSNTATEYAVKILSALGWQEAGASETGKTTSERGESNDSLSEDDIPF